MAALFIVHRHQLPLGIVAGAGAGAVTLTIAQGSGGLGCLLSGDGTYGRPTSVPWAMTFPDGVVPTNVPVHPTPLYEALAAVGIAAILWGLGKRWNPAAVFGAYLTLSGISRFLAEFLRINEPALLAADPASTLGARQPDSRRGPHRSYPVPEPSTTNIHRGGGARCWRGHERSVGRSGDRTVDSLSGVKLKSLFIIREPNARGSTLRLAGTGNPAGQIRPKQTTGRPGQ